MLFFAGILRAAYGEWSSEDCAAAEPNERTSPRLAEDSAQQNGEFSEK